MARRGLPAYLEPFFWDHDFSTLSWEEHRDFIVGRLLSAGDWRSIRWLVARLGLPGIRDWIIAHRARGLDPRQVRFWEIVLDLPAEPVSEWLEEKRANPWFRRVKK